MRNALEGRNFVIGIDGPSGAGKGVLARSLAARYNIPHFDTGLIYRAVAKVLTDSAEASKFPGSDQSTANTLEETEASETDFERAAINASAEINIDRLVWQPPQVQPQQVQPNVNNAEQVGESPEISVLRGEQIAAVASKVAAIGKVREILLKKQKNLVQSCGSIVLDGRDVTTVVCPEAEHRFFLTASAKERARRRAHETLAGDDKGKTKVGDTADINSNEATAKIQQQMQARDLQDTTRANAPLLLSEGVYEIDTTDYSAAEVLNEVVRIIESQRDG